METVPDLDHSELTADELGCTWHPGVQAAGIAGEASTTKRAKAWLGLGVRPTGGSRVAVSAQGGRMRGASFGRLATSGQLSLGGENSWGVDIDVNARAARTAASTDVERVLFAAVQPELEPAEARFDTRHVDASVWATRRYGDHGWALLPIGVDIEERRGNGERIERVIRKRAAVAGALRAYSTVLPEATLAVRAELGSENLHDALEVRSIKQTNLVVTADNVFTNVTSSGVRSLAFRGRVGAAWLRHQSTGETATLMDLEVGAAWRRKRWQLGFGVASIPSHTPDGGHIASLQRAEAVALHCIGALCVGGKAAVSVVRPVDEEIELSVRGYRTEATITYNLPGGFSIGTEARAESVASEHERSIGIVFGYRGHISRLDPRVVNNRCRCN